MKKRRVMDGYKFRSSPLYPMWLVDVVNIRTIENMDGALWVRVGHLFWKGDKWEQLDVRNPFPVADRSSLAFVIWAYRNEIRRVRYSK